MEVRQQGERQECEIYSRVCGYLRPLKQWNDGAQAQFKSRKFANINDNKDGI